MAIAFKIGVGNLLAEFLADAFIFLGLGQATGAISVLRLEPFLYLFNDFGVFIKSDCHGFSPLFLFFPFRTKRVLQDINRDQQNDRTDQNGIHLLNGYLMVEKFQVAVDSVLHRFNGR